MARSLNIESTMKKAHTNSFIRIVSSASHRSAYTVLLSFWLCWRDAKLSKVTWNACSVFAHSFRSGVAVEWWMCDKIHKTFCTQTIFSEKKVERWSARTSQFEFSFITYMYFTYARRQPINIHSNQTKPNQNHAKPNRYYHIIFIGKCKIHPTKMYRIYFHASKFPQWWAFLS